MFDNIINWKLLRGSHKFPGPDGGTCINEAAIIAAGFEYKSVGSAADCPPCFSRPIAQYAIQLNDRMSDGLRQKLLIPFVIKLSGTSDTPEIEKNRRDFIVLETARRIVGASCEIAKRPDLAAMCASIKSVSEVRPTMQIVRKELRAAYAAAYAADAAAAAAYAADDAAYAADAAADAAAAAAAYAADAAAAREKIWIIACEILQGAIDLGRHETLDMGLVCERLETVKRVKADA